MPCLKVLLAVGVLVCCSFFMAKGQNISVVDPSVYPYLMKLSLLRDAELFITDTEAGLLVSSKYILASNSVMDMNPSDITIIDQLGNFQHAAKVAGIVNNQFFYLKVCIRIEGEKYSFNESKFSDLSADTSNAELLYFDYWTRVLKRFSVSVMSKDNCTASFSQSISDTDICMYNLENTYTLACTFITDELSDSFTQYPVIAINGQVHGFLHFLRCDFVTFESYDDWTFTNLAHFRANIIAELPAVDNV